jgi:hypothetical protein
MRAAFPEKRSPASAPASGLDRAEDVFDQINPTIVTPQPEASLAVLYLALTQIGGAFG